MAASVAIYPLETVPDAPLTRPKPILGGPDIVRAQIFLPDGLYPSTFRIREVSADPASPLRGQLQQV
jgi:hypothetical protein